MMIGDPFLTINKVELGYLGFFSYFSNQGAPKEDLEDYVLVRLTLYIESSFQQFPWLFPPSPYHEESFP